MFIFSLFKSPSRYTNIYFIIDELLSKEKYYISLYDSTNPNKGYNMLSSSTLLNYKHTQDFKDNLSTIKTDIKSKNPSSNYLGVVFVKTSNMWSTRITIDKKLIFISNSYSEVEVAVQYDLYIINNNINRKRNFNDSDIDRLIDLYNIKYKIKNINKTSKFNGVSFNNKSKRWNAQLWIYNKPKHIGSFLTEDDAAIAYNKYIIDNNLNLELNDIEMKKISNSRHSVKRGKYFGVSYKKSNNKFTASIRQNGKTIFIGYYNSDIEAAEAYDKYLDLHNIDKSRNFPTEKENENFNMKYLKKFK